MSLMLNIPPAPLATNFSSNLSALVCSRSYDSTLPQSFALEEHSTFNVAPVKQFIKTCFDSAYQANITQFMPRILSMQSPENELIAAFGLREARGGHLFLENYFDTSIEAVLSSSLNTRVHRSDVIEVGNLSATHPGAARLLILAMTALLYSEGYQWVVFTGTSTIRNVFNRLGLHPTYLASASLNQLPEAEQANWGSYYENAPEVMAGNIRYGHQLLMHQPVYQEILAACKANYLDMASA